MTQYTLHHLLLLSQDTGHLLQATGQRDNIQGLRSHSPSLDQVAQYLHINIAVIWWHHCSLLTCYHRCMMVWMGLVCQLWSAMLRSGGSQSTGTECWASWHEKVLSLLDINHHCHTWCQYPRILASVPAYTWCSSWQRWSAPRCSKI